MYQPRRSLLANFGIAGIAAALAGCSLTSNPGGGTTATLDITKVTTDGQAAIAALQAALTSPAIQQLLAANAAIANKYLADASAALASLQASTGGTASVNTASVQSLVQTLTSNLTNAITMVEGVVPNFAPATSQATLMNFLAAAKTLIPIIMLAAGFFATPRRDTGMNETQALAVARKAHPVAGVALKRHAEMDFPPMRMPSPFRYMEWPKVG